MARRRFGNLVNDRNGSRPLLARALTVLAVVVSAFVSVVSVQPSSPGAAVARDPAPVDRQVREALADDGTTDFWVRFDDEADLDAAYRIKDWARRGQYVVDRLRATAETAQQDVTEVLASQHARYQRFWIADAILVHGGDRGLLDRVASVAGVARIAAPADARIVVPEHDEGVDPDRAPVGWNLADIRADKVWRRYDVHGEGVLVGSIDTGADYLHPELAASYAGRLPDGTTDHDYAWYDPGQACTPTEAAPCDDEGHGTAVLGTILGAESGVAPAARWIAAKGCGVDTCDIDDLLLSAQWMLAPTRVDGSHPDVARRPQLISNAWASSEGTAAWFDEAVDAWRASGQLAVFPTGDFRTAECGSVGSPASLPASYAVGGYDTTGGLLYSSGLGPSPIDGSTKPDLAAPAWEVPVPLPSGRHGLGYGTSFAAAHVVGAAALVLSAAPSLEGDADAVGSVLEDTARAAPDPDPFGCGATPTDGNSYGRGRLDALAAVASVATPGLASIAGTVTDRGSGDPITGATVTAAARTATTGPDGRYTLFVPAGSVTVNATASGYAASSATLVATAGARLHQDLALDPQPTTRLAVRVLDAGGHGWPLDARVRVDGLIRRTDPVTGLVAFHLPQGSHRLHVDAGAGYQPAMTDVDLGAVPATKRVELVADPSCTAPGLHLADGTFEDFEGGEAADGWTTVNNHPDPFDSTLGDWRFDNPGGRGNLTGGAGGFAILDSDRDFFYDEDSELVSPVVDLSGVSNPVIRWRQDVFLAADEVADVDLSLDGGGTWSNVWRQTGAPARGPRSEEVAIPEASGQDDVRVRFHYYDANFDWWWEVDDVLIGGSPCAVDDGGLVVGTVTDGPTGTPLSGATVTTGATSTHTRAGRYTLFSADLGPVAVTGSLEQFADDAASADVTADHVTRVDLALGSAHLQVPKPHVELSVPPGGRATTRLTITNDGSVDAHIRLVESDRGFTGLGPQRSIARVRHTRIEPPFGDRDDPDPGPAGVDTAPPWEEAAPFPHRVERHLAAAHRGRVYVFGGEHVRDDDYLTTSDELHVYDPGEERWRALPSSGRPRELAAGTFVGDELHVVGGNDELGTFTGTHQVYDVSEHSWRVLAPLPANLSALAIARLGPDLVTVGGCVSLGATCGAVADVYRYDSTRDEWSQLADYPERVGFLSCGGIDGLVYCSGGAHETYTGERHAYVYDPATDAWSAIADSPDPTWGAGYAVADGRLTTISGIELNGVVATTDVLAYDPVVDEWEHLPPIGVTVYLGAATCGLYWVGGRLGEYPDPRTRAFEHLDGHGCGGPDVPWLHRDPATFVVPAGGSTTVKVTVGPRGLRRPGAYEALLRVIDDAPTDLRPVRVDVTSTTPGTWGRVTGVLTADDACGAPGPPLANAQVTVTTAAGDHRITRTGDDGGWSVALRAGTSPVTVRIDKYGFASRRAEVTLAPGHVARLDAGLRHDAPCVRLRTGEVSVRLHRGQHVDVPLVVHNDGPHPLRSHVAETRLDLRSLPRFDYRGWAAGDPQLGDAPHQPAVPPVPGWFTAESSPVPWTGAAQVQCDGDGRHVYVISGTATTSLDTLFRFDAKRSTWTELAPLPQDAWPAGDPNSSGLFQPSAICVAGRIHVIGGFHSNKAVATHFVYNPASDSWTMAAPLPRPVADASLAVWDDQIYVVGGLIDQAAPSGQIDVYDVATDSWQTLTGQVPYPSDGPGWAQVGPYLYLISGYIDPFTDTNTESRRLDLRTLRWSRGPDLPGPRLDGSLVVTDKALYLVGGYEVGRGVLADVFRLPRADWADGTWDLWSSLPEPRWEHEAHCSEAITGGEIVSIGGWDSTFITTHVFVHGVVPERCPTNRVDIGWLRTSDAGPVAPHSRATMSVTIDARSLPVGTHDATLLLSTNDPGAPEVRVPVTVRVRP